LSLAHRTAPTAQSETALPLAGGGSSTRDVQQADTARSVHTARHTPHVECPVRRDFVCAFILQLQFSTRYRTPSVQSVPSTYDSHYSRLSTLSDRRCDMSMSTPNPNRAKYGMVWRARAGVSVFILERERRNHWADNTPNEDEIEIRACNTPTSA
jgi:hypothetical protein